MCFLDYEESQKIKNITVIESNIHPNNLTIFIEYNYQDFIVINYKDILQEDYDVVYKKQRNDFLKNFSQISDNEYSQTLMRQVEFQDKDEDINFLFIICKNFR